MLKQGVARLLKGDVAFAEFYRHLTALAPFALAFSGGVDSTLLLAISSTLSQAPACLALTAETPYIASWELKEAVAYGATLPIDHQIVKIDIPELIKDNPKLRCYYCKNALMTAIIDAARAAGIATVIDGSNYDDLADYRPGLTALRECGVISPFLDCQIGKSQIRQWSQQLNLPTWDKPAYACLLTRLESDKLIDRADLALIEAAETFLFSLGIRAVRVRKQGDLARIEVVAEQLDLVIAQRSVIDAQLKQLGFNYVTLDLAGYRMSGLLNLTDEE